MDAMGAPLANVPQRQLEPSALGEQCLRGKSSATGRSAGLDVVAFCDVGERAVAGELITGDGVKELSA